MFVDSSKKQKETIYTIFSQINSKLFNENTLQANAIESVETEGSKEQEELINPIDPNKIKNDLINLQKSLIQENLEAAIKVTKRLEHAVDILVDENKNIVEIHWAIYQFHSSARNAMFSQETKMGIAAVSGALVGLGAGIGLSIAIGLLSGGVSLAIQIPVLILYYTLHAGVGLLAVNFAYGLYAYDNPNPHEKRGKAVKDDLSAISKYRGTLFNCQSTAIKETSGSSYLEQHTVIKAP